MVARLKLKGIDGGSHKRWRMWLNSSLREEPYPGLDMFGSPAERWGCSSENPYTGAAWLSSARVVRCRVKSLNEQTLVPSCQRVMSGTLGRLPVLNRRKVGMTSSPHGLYDQGCTRPTMQCTEGSELARASKSQKALPSSDCRLQLACMKPESLVIVGQHTTVNVFLSLVHTARQATKVGGTRSRQANPQGRQVPKVNSAIGTKS